MVGTGKEKLVVKLTEDGALNSEAVAYALREVDRADFVPDEFKDFAYADEALPIGAGQTISQPQTVVFMLEKLGVKWGERVLEIGYGSGWQTALLAELVGDGGHVYSFEIVPDLCEFGIGNLSKYGNLASRVTTFCASAEYGHAAAAPYERIISAAEVDEVPQAWRDQLALRGRMIYPQEYSLVLEEKNSDGSFSVERHPGFVFVSFVKRQPS